MEKLKIIHFPLTGLLSGSLMGLCFSYNQFYLAFFALIPYLYVLVKITSVKKECIKYIKTKLFLLNLFYVFPFFGSFLSWISFFHFLAYPGVLIALTVYFWLTSLFILRLSKKFPQYQFLWIIGSFIGLEYLRTVGFLRFPYGNLGYSQWNFNTLIQIVDITGHLGISFLIYLFNMAFVYLIIRIKNIKGKWQIKKTFKIIPLSLYSAIVLFLTFIIYGVYQKNHLKMVVEKKISLVQHWIDYNQPLDQSKNFNHINRNTYFTSQYQPDLLIWPETAVIFDFQDNLVKNNPLALKYFNLITNFSKGNNEKNTYFLFGTIKRTSKYIVQINSNQSAKSQKTAGHTKSKIYNTALLLSPQGDILEEYSKKLLVPIAEWFPYTWIIETFPFIKSILQQAGASQFSPGKKMTIFEIPKNRFSVLICYEDVFGDFTRKFTQQRVNFFVVLTNDAWSYSEKSQWMHMVLSIFRAIENRRAFLRATNAGVTCSINAKGEIVDILPMFKEGFINTKAYTSDKKTIYVSLGNEPYRWLSILLILIFFISFIKKNND